VLHYKSEYEALVRGPRGTQVVASPIPLAVSRGGRYRAVDLRLRRTAAGFSPRLSHTQISIARHLAGGVVVGSHGLTITPEGSNVTGTSVNDKEVFFANVAADADAVIAPTAGGAEIFASLRSRDSPEVLRYRLGLTAGAILRQRHGQVEAIRAGRVVARIPAPTARDARSECAGR
jgi:predicted nuclease with RNAse H fold